MIRLLKVHLTEELGDLPPVGDLAPVDLIGRTPLGWAMTSNETSAKKNAKEIRQELFSPGDRSICPITPSSFRSSRRYRDGDNCIEYGFSELPGWRVNMEDSLCCCPELGKYSLFGVFDGHSDNAAVSKYLATHIPKLFLHYIQKDSSYTLPQALEKACTQADKLLYDDHATLLPTPNCGSTAIIAVVSDDSIVIANVGDCRAILISGSEDSIQTLPLSQD